MRFLSRLFAPAVLAVGLCLLATTTAEAGRGGGGGGRSGGGGGRGFAGGGYRGGYGGGYRGGYGGYGYGRGYGGYGYGGWGYGGFYPWFGLGYGDWGYPGYAYSYPLYSGYAYAPAYTPTSTYYAPTVVYSDSGVTTQQSAYYNPGQSTQATVEVRVPADATVWFDGTKTKLSGDDRVFESPPLETGRTYTYDVKAQWMKDGKPVEVTRTVQVRAGQRSMADFTVK